ncbi:MAG: GIY-YIG nuclease family protein [Candidatus Helarchaeota archaeon]
MCPYYVYIVKCKDGTLYTGYTNDIKRRLKEHNNGQSKYCRGRRPVKLLHMEIFSTQSSAMRRELEIKKLPRRVKLKLANGDLNKN